MTNTTALRRRHQRHVRAALATLATLVASLCVAAPAMAWEPTDPFWNSSPSGSAGTWQLPRVGAPAAWNLAPDGGFTGRGVIVAVVDSGIDVTHPDLAGRVLPGYDAISRKADTRDQQYTTDYVGHGTAVASVIAGTADNDFGVVGVAPQATILPVKVVDDYYDVGFNGVSGIDPQVEARGIRWAVDHGAQVINLSIGGERGTPAESRALQYARAHGVLPICASGNEGAKSISYPARFATCVSVGAINGAGAKAKFSNAGVGLDLMAPGVHVPVALPDYVKKSKVAYEDGTSFATPVVAGAAALLAGRGLGADAIEQLLESTATDMGAAGLDTATGHGLVNVAAAAAAAPAPVVPATPDGAPTCATLGGVFAFTAYAVQTSKLPVGTCHDPEHQPITTSVVTTSPTAAGTQLAPSPSFAFDGVELLTPVSGYTVDSVGVVAGDGRTASVETAIQVSAPATRTGRREAEGYAGAAIRTQARRHHQGKVRITGGSCRALNTQRWLCNKVTWFAGQNFFDGKVILTYFRFDGKEYVRALYIGVEINHTCVKRYGVRNCIAPAFWTL